MKLIEREISVTAPAFETDLFGQISNNVAEAMGPSEFPIRFAVTKSSNRWTCEVGFLSALEKSVRALPRSIFDFRKRTRERQGSFNAALIIPTGVGAEIGGHAGDGTPAARLLSTVCDRLILHPNVVNGSDLNEMPQNSLYVEGSVLSRLLMGTVGLELTRANRVIVVVDDHPDQHFVESAINTVGAARATYGLNCVGVVKLRPAIQMWAEYAPSGRAVGVVNGLDHCLDVLDGMSTEFDAIAISSVIRVPQNYHLDYFRSEGAMINPWGGVEAMLTHTITSLMNRPAAHAPMFESRGIENLETGIVDPRMSAEAISVSFLQCVLKGLHRSPRIAGISQSADTTGMIAAEDISCIIIPDGCLGLPTLAALVQGINVIAVEENRTIMRNDLSFLPWRRGQFHHVRSYLEAAGVIQAMKDGLDVASLRRPLPYTPIFENSVAETWEHVPRSEISSQ